MLATVVVIIQRMVDAVDDVVDTWFRDPLSDDRIFGLSVSFVWFQVGTLRRRAIDPAPRSISAVGILLVALGEVEVASDILCHIAGIAGADTNVLGLSMGIERLVQTKLVDFDAPGSGEPRLGDDEVRRKWIRDTNWQHRYPEWFWCLFPLDIWRTIGDGIVHDGTWIARLL